MRLGKISIDRPLVLAPMEDITDIPFRLMARRLGADWVTTEFASSDALIRGQEKILKKIELVDAERPVGIQIFGGNAETLEQAVRVVEKFKPDFIDINAGCWSRRHALRGEGAGLLLDLPHLEEILHRLVRSTHLPVTLKTRLGWDEKKIVIIEVAQMAEQAGIKALTVHCRTRSQGYKGKAEWSWLPKVKSAVHIPIIGNGDVLSPSDVKTLFELGCDGVMIGRGAIANPWIFSQARHYLETNKILPVPSLKDRIETCLTHLKLSVGYRGPRWGVIHFRKYYAGYLRGLTHVAKLRAELMQIATEDEVREKLLHFLKSSETATKS